MANLPNADPDIKRLFDEADNCDFNPDEEMQSWAKGAAPSNLDEIMPEGAKPAAPRGESSFTIPPSKKLRGKPYFIHDQLFWVMTKSGSHFPVMLKGTQIGDAIRISVLYNQEDNIGDRVKCEDPKKGHETVFDVEPRTPGFQLAPNYDNLTVYSVTWFNSECQSDEVTFRFMPNCLNFCSQPKSCSEPLLKFELLNTDGTILTTSKWNLRVCSNPKRDFELMMDSVDHNTGEKRKPLYSKASENKKMKKEHLELAPAHAEQEHQDTPSCSVTRHEPEVATAADFITCQALSDQPSASREEIIHIFGPEASPPLLEEKGCVETGHQPTDTKAAS